MNNHIDNLDLHRRSARLVEVDCELGVSPKCRKSWEIRYSRAIDSREQNGKIICLYCSRTHKFSGRGNPNCKYKSLDDNFFKYADTEEKAYLLGWIAGDGTVQPENHIEIVIHEKDKYILECLRDIICIDLPIWEKDDCFVGLRICSSQITKDVCNWLRIKPGAKNLTVSFPELENEQLKWHFIRGLFDADGHIIKNHVYQKHCRCCISSTSLLMKDYINNFCNINCRISKNQIIWNGNKAISFLDKMYDNSSFLLRRKYNMYVYWRSQYESSNAYIDSETSGR